MKQPAKQFFLFSFVFGLTVFVNDTAKADSVKVGHGSYSLVRPVGCDPLPDTIFTTPSIKGAIPTNQWWSSLVWEKYSQNLFPHPLAINCNPRGLAIAYPGSGIVGAGGHIMGGGTRYSNLRINQLSGAVRKVIPFLELRSGEIITGFLEQKDRAGPEARLTSL